MSEVYDKVVSKVLVFTPTPRKPPTNSILAKKIVTIQHPQQQTNAISQGIVISRQ